MNKNTSFLIVALFLFAAPLVHAQDLPEIIKNGFSAYEEDGPKAAIEAWIKGSSIDGSQDAMSQANMFRKVEDFFGEYQGYDLYKSNPLGPKSHLYLITINYRKGVLYAKYITYKPAGKKEIIQTFKFNTEVDQVWPPNMIYGTIK